LKTLKCVILLSLLSILCGAAQAGDARLSWSAPTQRVNGAPLDNLAGFRVYWGQESRNYTSQAEINAPAVLEYFIDQLGAGTWYFAVTAFDATGLESAYSAEVSKTIEQELPPLPPADPRVVSGEALVAYTLVQTANRIVLVPVGTVASGTLCDGTQAIRDANGVTGYVIPRESVTWAGTVRPRVVVAECN
jgi:hypothetical protein